MNAPESKNKYTAGVIASAVTALTWGVQAVVLKMAVLNIAPSTIAWFRFVIAGSVIFFYLNITNRREFWNYIKKPQIPAILAGIFLAINYVSFMKGIELTSPSNAQIAIQLGPFGLALYGVFFFKEKLRPLQKFGMILTPLGLALFFKDQLAEFLNYRQDFIYGYLWVILAAVTWIVYSVFQKVLGQKVQNSFVLFIVFVTASVFLLPWSHINQSLRWTSYQWLMIFFLGSTTLISYGSLSTALARAPASIVSMVITVNPLLTIAIMTQLPATNKLGLQPERIQALGLCGALLVVSGVILSVYRPFSRRN